MVIITDFGQRKDLHKMLKIYRSSKNFTYAFFILFFIIQNPKNAGLIDVKMDSH